MGDGRGTDGDLRGEEGGDVGCGWGEEFGVGDYVNCWEWAFGGGGAVDGGVVVVVCVFGRREGEVDVAVGELFVVAGER